MNDQRNSAGSAAGVLRAFGGVAVALAFLASADPARAAGGSCGDLAGLPISSGRITGAEVVPPGAAPFNASRAFCRVRASLTPSSDSDITIEVWLPLQWNGKFLAVGNSDAAGVLNYEGMRDAVSRGYATSSTDTGHVGNSMAFALGHREKYVDFGYRALHEMTVHAKRIVEAFYAVPAKHAYWNGCSQGGRQGITEAARYPSDYDAIIAGAPAIDYMRLHAARMALNVFVHRSAGSYIPPEKYPAIHRAVVAACDRVDGLADGLIGAPTECRFDPRVLECHNGDEPSCLTPAQVETVRGLYAPIADPATGRIVSPPLLQPGSELEWGRLAGPEPLWNALEPFKYVVFHDPRWDWRAFKLSVDLPRALDADRGVIDFTGTDLGQFFARGGKLLMYHGWADPQVPPLNTVTYFDEVVREAGKASRGRSIALYMEPGVSHCNGGDGPDTFDAVEVVEGWVQRGRAPDPIVAAHYSNGTVDRSRPLCEYPEVARYQGTGSVDAAASFRCEAGEPPAARRDRREAANGAHRLDRLR